MFASRFSFTSNWFRCMCLARRWLFRLRLARLPYSRSFRRCFALACSQFTVCARSSVCMCRVSQLSYGELLLLPLLWFISPKTLCDVSIFAYGRRKRERESKRSIRGSSTKTATLTTTVLRNTVHRLPNLQPNRVNRGEFLWCCSNWPRFLHGKHNHTLPSFTATAFGRQATSTQQHTSKHQIFTQRLQPIDYKRFVPGVYLQAARLQHTSGHFKTINFQPFFRTNASLTTETWTKRWLKRFLSTCWHC